MKKHLLLSFAAALLALAGRAQTVAIDNPLYGTSGNVATATSNYAVSEAIYYDSEIGSSNFLTAGTAINHVDFSVNTVGTPTTMNNVRIYMMNVPSTTTTLATATYSTAGYTLVYDGSLTAPSIGWAGVDLNTPFVRTAGTNLQVMVERKDNATHAGYIFNCANATTGPLNSRRYNNTTAISAATSLTASAFRAAIRLQHTTPNDMAVNAVYGLGTTGKGIGNVITAYVANIGTAAQSNVQISLNVTGANTFTNSITIASIPVGASGYVTFPAFNPANTGTQTITVSVGTDDYAGNNSKSISQEVALNQLSYSIGTVASAGVNAGQGNEVAAKFSVPYGNTISSVNAYFTTAGNTYDVAIYNNVNSLPGTAIATLTGLTSVVGLNNIPFLTPVSVSDSFYVAIKQTGTALGISYQDENPCRLNSYFLKSGTNPWFDLAGNPSNTFRLMLGVTLGSTLPVSISSFTGERRNTVNVLNWSTATEVNNKAFQLQRSADGRDFSTIATIASLAENGNSSTALNYAYTDEKALKGNNYYRLVQVDKDGKTATSSVVLIKGQKTDKLEISTIYPNPVTTKLNMQVAAEKAGAVNFVITDINGKVVLQQNIQVQEGNNNIQIGVANLINGNYFIKAVCAEGCETAVKKFSKQ